MYSFWKLRPRRIVRQLLRIGSSDFYRFYLDAKLENNARFPRVLFRIHLRAIFDYLMGEGGRKQFYEAELVLEK